MAWYDHKCIKTNKIYYVFLFSWNISFRGQLIKERKYGIAEGERKQHDIQGEKMKTTIATQ